MTTAMVPEQQHSDAESGSIKISVPAGSQCQDRSDCSDNADNEGKQFAAKEEAADRTETTLVEDGRVQQRWSGDWSEAWTEVSSDEWTEQWSDEWSDEWEVEEDEEGSEQGYESSAGQMSEQEATERREDEASDGRSTRHIAPEYDNYLHGYSWPLRPSPCKPREPLSLEALKACKLPDGVVEEETDPSHEWTLW